MGAATSRSLENQSDGHRSLSSLKALIRSHAAGNEDRSYIVATQVAAGPRRTDGGTAEMAL